MYTNIGGISQIVFIAGMPVTSQYAFLVQCFAYLCLQSLIQPTVCSALKTIAGQAVTYLS